MLDWEKHKFNMVRILKDIYEHPRLGNYLGFKGGTACNFFYGLPRHSVDLDFDLLFSENMTEDDKQEREKFVFEEINKILKRYSEFKVREATIKRYTIFFLLSYGEGEHTVKIEISRRPMKSKFVVEEYLGIPMLVIVKEDAFANKLVALLDRKKVAMRDLFDVHFFFSDGWEINEEIIGEKTGKSLDEYLDDCVKFIKKLSVRNILDGLGELLDQSQKDWARDKLKDDTIFLIKAYRERLVKKGFVKGIK